MAINGSALCFLAGLAFAWPLAIGFEGMSTTSAVNELCPFSGEAVQADSQTEFEGMTVGFCNPNCRDKFAADPDSFPEAVLAFRAAFSQQRWHQTRDSIKERRGDRSYLEAFRDSDLSVGLYAPVGEDGQSPHKQAELYIVESGTGNFVRGEETVKFGPGDILHVPAHMEHRFVDFSEDFRTWVVFYGESIDR